MQRDGNDKLKTGITPGWRKDTSYRNTMSSSYCSYCGQKFYSEWGSPAQEKNACASCFGLKGKTIVECEIHGRFIGFINNENKIVGDCPDCYMINLKRKEIEDEQISRLFSRFRVIRSLFRPRNIIVISLTTAFVLLCLRTEKYFSPSEKLIILYFIKAELIFSFVVCLLHKLILEQIGIFEERSLARLKNRLKSAK